MKHISAPLEFIEKYYVSDLAERDSKESIWSLQQLKAVSGDTILSVGCGPNFYDDIQFFANIPKIFVGIDINKNNIAFLKKSNHPELLKRKKKLADNKSSIELIIGDIKRKRRGFNDRFDAIYAIGVLGMFNKKDTQKIYKLLYSYLKPYGKIINIDRTEPYLSDALLKERKDYDWYSEMGHSIKDIGDIITATGFVILKHSIYNVTNPKDYSWGKIYAYIAQK